jgi:hypothetical protein
MNTSLTPTQIAELQTENYELKNTLQNLRENLAKLAGDSPFVKVGPWLFLFTDIRRIKANEHGRLDKLNETEFFGEVLVQDLENLVSAHYRKARENLD